MFGRVIKAEDNLMVLENLDKNIEANYLNYHVIFEEIDRKIVGEIIGLTENQIEILLVGEIISDKFRSGVFKKPHFKTKPRIIYKSEVELFIGDQDRTNKDSLLIGKSNVYENFSVSVDLNNFFSNHFAVIGNTGSGKSCGVARIIQNLFAENQSELPVNSHIVIFDVYGEYNNAFESLNNISGVGFKSFTTQTNFEEGEILNLPAYFLDVDDLALLLNATSPSQLPILDKAIKLVYIFKGTNEIMQEYKNDIIATAILDILSSGKNPSQIRDQVVAVLSHYNTNTLNLNTEITQPGYSRTIRQCLNIDQQGKMNSVQFVVDFLSNYRRLDLSSMKINSQITYDLDDLYYALEFALISEGILKSERIFDELNQLKVRLLQIINSENKIFFKPSSERISKTDYIKNLFDGNKKRQIINMNLNYIDERFAKMLTKIYTKMFFDFATKLEKRATYPIHIILEEAHRYIQNDEDVNVLGYNIFDRITKEGRKYGVLLGLITQRPSELSSTALSQCTNFLVFRLFHPDDIMIVENISSNINVEIIEKVKSLSPGTALIFGVAFKLPLLVSLTLPEPMPKSTSVDIKTMWF